MAGCPNLPSPTPAVDFLHSKAPVATNLEGGQFMSLQEAIDGGRMDAEVIGEFTHCEHARRNGVPLGLHWAPF